MPTTLHVFNVEAHMFRRHFDEIDFVLSGKHGINP